MRNIVETIEDEYTIYDEGKRIYFVADDGRVVATIKNDEFGVYKYYNLFNEYVCSLKSKDVAIRYVKNEFQRNKELNEKRTKDYIKFEKQDERFFRMFCGFAALAVIVICLFFIATCLR